MSSVSENFSVILFCGRWLPTKKVRRGRRNIRIWRADFEIERHCIFMAALSGPNNDQQHKFKQLAEADRQLTMGLDELPCLGLHSHSRHAFATRFARCWPVCRDGGIGRRSGLKIRRGQPLASSSLAPGTKINQGFVKMAQGRSQTLFCVFLPFIPLLSGRHQRRGQAPSAGSFSDRFLTNSPAISAAQNAHAQA